MTLKVELKPGERIIVGTALIRNGESRTRFHIEGEAPILREKDILTPATADSPGKKIYLAVQLMYLTGRSVRAPRVLFPAGPGFPQSRPERAAAHRRDQQPDSRRRSLQGPEGRQAAHRVRTGADRPCNRRRTRIRR